MSREGRWSTKRHGSRICGGQEPQSAATVAAPSVTKRPLHAGFRRWIARSSLFGAAMVATSFHDASSNAASVVMVRGPGRADADAEKEYGEVRLYPTRMRFVTGVARAYEDDFPPELSHLVKETDFDTAINQINNTMQDYWPCFFCILCGYGCCPCTLGLSLSCPNFCIRDAEQYVRALLTRINKRVCFERVGVEWQLLRSCGRSWIQITYPLALKKPPLVTYQNGILPSPTPLVAPNGNHPVGQETPASSSALSAATHLFHKEKA